MKKLGPLLGAAGGSVEVGQPGPDTLGGLAGLALHLAGLTSHFSVSPAPVASPRW